MEKILNRLAICAKILLLLQTMPSLGNTHEHSPVMWLQELPVDIHVQGLKHLSPYDCGSHSGKKNAKLSGIFRGHIMKKQLKALSPYPHIGQVVEN